MTVRILVGHVLDRLRGLPAESVHCVVTSPPYYGLRDFGIEPQVWGDWRGSLGLEPSLALYLDHMVEVFREVRRVMRKDATCWLNIGDSYAGKQLQMIPARLAIRLQEDGWWVRSDICWAKRAPMPESCADRPTSAWEHVFLLTKSARYYYDAEAVKEEAEGEASGSSHHHSLVGTKDYHGRRTADFQGYRPTKRNQRNVWLLGPEPFPEAHFATFPTEIPRRAILAGTSERGVCPKCAAPWERITRKDFRPTQDPQFSKGGQKGMDASNQWGETPRGINDVETLGWRPTCGCGADALLPATVLDPFLGSGTTALVADRLGRDCVGIELSPEYAAMARRRIGADAPLLAEVGD